MTTIEQMKKLAAEAEEFRPIPGFDGYQVSNLGVLIGYNGFPRKLRIHEKRQCVSFRKDGKNLTRNIHSLVLLAFVGPKPKGLVIRHKDGNSLNNRLDNICYGTYQENEADKKIHGTCPMGDNHPQCKISDRDVVFIRKNYDPRSPIYGRSALAKKFSVSPRTIGKIVSGEKRKSAYAALNDGKGE